MPLKFNPNYALSNQLASWLMQVEEIKEKISHFPLTLKVLTSLRETARLYTTHFSTMIEGNRLTPDQVIEVLKHKEHFPGRERDENEVKGYYAAIQYVEKLAAKGNPISEKVIQELHSLVMGNGRKKTKPTPYRDGQNVIRDSRSRAIIYMPPESKDVKSLMKAMVKWLNSNNDIPCPIVAAIAHYQFATIHPYYDGNGRTARLLTTLILHLGGYDLKGLYSLEEYYARNLAVYYDAISIGPSHNYYFGRAESDITSWIEYFIEGMLYSFKAVLEQMSIADVSGKQSHEFLLRKLDAKQRKALELFQEYELLTSNQIGNLFGFKPRTSSALCKKWVESGFLEIVDFSKKGRKYRLSSEYCLLLT